ncbi:hypothetical protein HAX54_025580 [Datura stramonium]|uniref:Uncharacterized protein n=1 Tax=Datura stramonium TaxID=4076 RepID=A0ABS8S6J6_DATST|nr:hypothetical protein [Datura stramonium]
MVPFRQHCDMTQLLSLFLYENELSSPIPSSIGNCTNLQDLNSLRGSIPFSSGNCRDLDTLVLSSNSLNGGLPPSLSNCTNLKVLAAFSSGFIPPELANLVNLQGLDLSNNGFGREIHSAITTASRETLRLLIPQERGRCVQCLIQKKAQIAQNSTLRSYDLQSNNGRHLSGAETAMIALGVLLFTISLLLVIAYMLLWRKNSGKGVAISAQEDFGIAKLLDQSAATSTSNTLQVQVGYMAPDIVRWVRSVWTETEEIEKIVDPSLLDEFIDSSVMEQVIEVFSLALRCTEKEVSKKDPQWKKREVVKLLTRFSLFLLVEDDRNLFTAAV